MKRIILLAVLSFAFSAKAQESKSTKQYRSAESGQYVSKSTADKSPSTTYSTTRSTSTKSTSTSTSSSSSSGSTGSRSKK
ncbi:MAG: hypothetical protein V4497_01335 [Bacteroidota bacterium]